MLDQAITEYLHSAPRLVRNIHGHLTDRELRFLALMAACPLAEGEILSLGCGLGQSEIVMAEAVRLAGESRLSVIDPLKTVFYQTSLEKVEVTLRDANVADIVDFHHVFPEEISEIWDRPLRLLWFGAEHSEQGAEVDFDEYFEHLTDGAIVAFHNAVKRRDSGLMVFTEEILLDEHFGASGVCGTIGWARYHVDPANAVKFQTQKTALYQSLTPLLPFVTHGRKPSWWSRLALKLRELRIPHQSVDPESWLRNVA